MNINKRKRQISGLKMAPLVNEFTTNFNMIYGNKEKSMKSSTIGSRITNKKKSAIKTTAKIANDVKVFNIKVNALVDKRKQQVQEKIGKYGEVLSTRKMREIGKIAIGKPRTLSEKMRNALNLQGNNHLQNLIERLPIIIGRPLTAEELDLLNEVFAELEPIDRYNLIKEYLDLRKAYFESESAYDASIYEKEIISEESIQEFFDILRNMKQSYEEKVALAYATETGYN